MRVEWSIALRSEPYSPNVVSRTVPYSWWKYRASNDRNCNWSLPNRLLLWLTWLFAAFALHLTSSSLPFNVSAVFFHSDLETYRENLVIVAFGIELSQFEPFFYSWFCRLQVLKWMFLIVWLIWVLCFLIARLFESNSILMSIDYQRC